MEEALPGWVAASWISVAIIVAIGACASDEVGHTKTTEKRTTETPTEKTTVTETHEKTTTLDPR